MQTILIVDDELSACHNLLKDTLQYALGRRYTTFFAESGPEALTVLKTQAIDLVLLDLMMPDMDGFDVLTQAKETSTAKIVILSALSDQSTADRCLSLGAAGYIVKPLTLTALIRKLSRMLGKPEV